MEFKIEDDVYEKSNGTYWKIMEKASALEDEPPVKWKCSHWLIDRPGRRLVEHIFEEVELTHYAPEIGHLR